MSWNPDWKLVLSTSVSKDWDIRDHDYYWNIFTGMINLNFGPIYVRTKNAIEQSFFFIFFFFIIFFFFVCLILVVIYFLVLWISKISVTVMSQLSSCTFCYRFPISKMHNNRKSMHYNINSLKIVWMDAKSLCNFCIPLLLHPYKKERNFRKEKLFKFIFFLYLGTWKNTFPSVMLVWKSS